MAEKKDSGKADGAAAQVQSAVDEETEQGFRGVEVDKVDNHAYTVAGVTAGEWVPEMEADPVQARRDAAKPKASD